MAMERRGLLTGLAASVAALLATRRHAGAQDYVPPKIGRYKVEGMFWTRDLVIEDATNYAVYEARNGPFYGRGTYSFDGRSVRFLTGPFYEMGYRGSSIIGDDGKHRIRLGNTSDAIFLD
ncbi:MAG: hypothetical protein QOG83_3276 [Alphaproteobacteria bacterium]|nr:hypothetical protein [Alphaproteobacteria bacterium]